MSTGQQLSLDDPSPREAAVSRRVVMGGVVAASGAAVLAACGAPATGTSSPAAPASAASTPSEPSASASSAPGPATGGGEKIIALKEVPVGGSAAATLDGKPIIVSQPTAGKAVAFSAICTHKGCPVKPAGAELHCPCHGSVYNALTGQNVSGPAPSPLPAVGVTVVKGEVVSA